MFVFLIKDTVTCVDDETSAALSDACLVWLLSCGISSLLIEFVE